MLVGEAQHAVAVWLRIPAHVNRRALLALAAPHGDEVGEVGGQLPGELEVGLALAVVGDLDIRVQALADEARDTNLHLAVAFLTTHLAVVVTVWRGRADVVGERGVRIYGAEGIQPRRLAVDEQAQAGEQAQVVLVQALQAVGDSARPISDEQRAAMIGEDEVREDAQQGIARHTRILPLAFLRIGAAGSLARGSYSAGRCRHRIEEGAVPANGGRHSSRYANIGRLVERHL